MASARLRIASYNVHAWMGTDRRLDPGRCIEVLRELDAGLVAIQEARVLSSPSISAPLARYCHEAGYGWVEGPTLRRSDATYGNLLLSLFPVRRTARLDLTIAPREPRGAIAAQVECGRERLTVVATHLGLRFRERVAQVSRLLNWIHTELTWARGAPISLVGDVNEWRARASTLRRIDADFGAVPTPATFPSFRPWLKLDRIWVKPSCALSGSVRVHRSARARRASDHLPIVAELALSRCVAQPSGDASERG